MRLLLHDRYVVTGSDRAHDLATGKETPLDALATSVGEVPHMLAPLLDALDHGRDGEPAWRILALRDPAEARSLVQAIAACARLKGYVPVAVHLYQQALQMLGGELADRAVVLIDSDDLGARAHASLLAAASVSPRPHMLVTVRQPPRHLNVAREAHPRFGSAPGQAPASAHPEVVRLLARASRANEFVLAGRHAAAERLLRDVAAALERRHAFGEAARTAIELGWILYERGRAADADACGGDAARVAELGRDATSACDGRLLQAWTRLDQLRLSDAESMARAVMLGAPSDVIAGRARATLAQCLLAQGRHRELAAVDLDFTGGEELDSRWRASRFDAAVAALADSGRLFEAGRRVRLALDGWSDASPLPKAILHTAHLRVVMATGDLALAREVLERALAAAAHARAPLRALRSRAVWCTGLARGGAHDACVEVKRKAARLLRVAPAILQREFDAGARPPAPRQTRVTASDDTSLAARLLTLAQDDDDVEAVKSVLTLVLRELDAARVEVVSGDAGPPSLLAAAGSGPGAAVSVRVLDAGIAIGFEAGSDVGVPVRVGSRLVAALTARWPSGRGRPDDAQPVLECAAAVLAIRVEAMHQRAREAAAVSVEIPELIGVGTSMTALRKAVLRAARAPFAVLIEGESGVGKELVARAIHHLSARRDRRFSDVNCAALPDELFEAELFGHARGAFTGAVAERAGLFEEASGGTLFLDEVAELTPRAQAKLLRAVQQQEVRRVGESFVRRVDVRLVAAANRQMSGEVEAGRFRSDLLYRLDVIHIRIPPLRERPEDIPVIARSLWQHAAERTGSRATLTAAVMAALAHYSWPGNVRELQNVLAALAVAAPSRGRVRASLLPPVISSASGVSAGQLAAARDQFERRFIELALARAGGNRSRAARAIGLSRQGLLKSMARLGLRAGAR